GWSYLNEWDSGSGQELPGAEVVGRNGRRRAGRGWQGRHTQRRIRDAVSTPPKRESRGVDVGIDRRAVVAQLLGGGRLGVHRVHHQKTAGVMRRAGQSGRDVELEAPVVLGL